jgi:hypothetical protein
VAARGSWARHSGWLRKHWRGLFSALVLGIGAPVQVVAGWASEQDRLLWLVGAGLCVGIGVALPFLGHTQSEGHLEEQEAGGLQAQTVTASNRSVLVGQQTASDGGVAVGAQQQRGIGPMLQAAGPMHVYLGQPPPPSEPRDTSPPSPERVWNIPPPVRSFTGRDQQLHDLREQLVDGHAAALVPTAAMYGMGGVGKTQLALAYAHRYQEHYGLGWWIHAANDVEIITALGELAVELGLPVDVRPQRLVTRVHQALTGRQDWLLVFDNAEQPDALKRFVSSDDMIGGCPGSMAA